VSSKCWEESKRIFAFLWKGWFSRLFQRHPVIHTTLTAATMTATSAMNHVLLRIFALSPELVIQNPA